MTMRRAGYAPLESAGEYVCECLRDGERVSPKWGEKAVHERVVRCRDCIFCEEDVTTVGINGDEIATGSQCGWLGLWVKPDGFCAWGELKED